ncbi:MAG: diacylglyceryl transferase [Flavobacteriaceae bacterium]|nr:diacylglyceryl transferase [Flavobacteriaceae bacterium]
MNFKNLKEKWGVSSNIQLIIIFIVFGITGSLSVRLGKPLLDFIHLIPENFESIPLGNFIYWILRILIIFPIYQILLLIIAAIFFQFNFFWNFEKKILKRMGFKRFFKNS